MTSAKEMQFKSVNGLWNGRRLEQDTPVDHRVRYLLKPHFMLAANNTINTDTGSATAKNRSKCCQKSFQNDFHSNGNHT